MAVGAAIARGPAAVPGIPSVVYQSESGLAEDADDVSEEEVPLERHRKKIGINAAIPPIDGTRRGTCVRGSRKVEPKGDCHVVVDSIDRTVMKQRDGST